MDKPVGIFIITVLTCLIFYWSNIPHKRRILLSLSWLMVMLMVVFIYNFLADMFEGITHASGD